MPSVKEKIIHGQFLKRLWQRTFKTYERHHATDKRSPLKIKEERNSPESKHRGNLPQHNKGYI